MPVHDELGLCSKLASYVNIQILSSARALHSLYNEDPPLQGKVFFCFVDVFQRTNERFFSGDYSRWVKRKY